MSETLVFSLVVLLICGLLLVVYFHKRRTSSTRTPAALANQVLRYPERILIDVPLFASTAQGISNYDFLLKTEAELASIGELESRRQFLLRFAEVVNLPSKVTLKNLSDFLFQDAPVLFKDTLSWEGRCNNAMHFLELTYRLIDFAENGKSLKNLQTRSPNRKKQSPKKPSNDLQGMDAKIMQEWNELNNAVHRAISSLDYLKKNYKIKDQNDSINHRSLRLIEEERVPHLIPFLIAARDVCQNALISMAHTKH